MTFQNKHTATLVTLLIGFSLLSGCGTTGSERAEKASTKMEVVDGDIKAAVAQIDATNISLKNLINPEQLNTNEAFKNYSDNVDKMEKAGERLIKHTDEMSARGQDYFDEWRKQGDTYTNPQIRELSEQRRSDLSRVFRRISESSIGVRGSFITYMSDIKEIKSYLTTDLTNKGIEAITPVSEKAINDGENLKSAVIPVLSALDNARSEMAQGQ